MKSWRAILQRIFLASVFVLMPSAASFAQSRPAEPIRVVLKGYDPVAYFIEGRPVKGAAEIKHDWDGERYLFSNAGNKARFVSNPERYAPQFGGYCTGSMSNGRKNEADPEAWKIVDGKLYVFAAVKFKDTGDTDPGVYGRAAKNWQQAKR